jgi:hypothetical protein
MKSVVLLALFFGHHHFGSLARHRMNLAVEMNTLVELLFAYPLNVPQVPLFSWPPIKVHIHGNL